MTPHKQMFRHDPENGVYGDCYRTAVACLLNIKPGDVPHQHFAMTNGEQNRLMDEWLNVRGERILAIAFPGDQNPGDVLNAVEVWNPGVHFLFSGRSPRGTNHTVVAGGGKIVNDPHPDGGDLVGPCDDDFWWVEFIGKVV